jgi:hypothetical protein
MGGATSVGGDDRCAKGQIAVHPQAPTHPAGAAKLRRCERHGHWRPPGPQAPGH